MERYFSTRMPATRFLANVLIFSLGALLPVLALYVLLTPGFASALAQGGPHLRLFLRQIVANGLPVILATNYVGFFLFALTHDRHYGDRDPAIFIAIDVIVRITLFIVLHAAIYVLSADWFGSFGSDRTVALRVVAPTLSRSALFENISGVYLYATMASALPLYKSVAGRSKGLSPITRLFTRPAGPFAVAIIVFGAVLIFLTLAARALLMLQE